MDKLELPDLKKHLIGLVNFFEQKGYSLKPYPKIIFSWENNPNDLTAPTGHYTSENNQVVLYCNGRHKKDIFNTGSHELWHKHQDVEGRLNYGEMDNTTNYTEGSPHLKEIEEEAYKMGNILRREYTESLQKQS